LIFDKEKLEIILCSLKLYELNLEDAVEVIKGKADKPWNKKSLEVSEKTITLTKEIMADIEHCLGNE
jgi:hypothetical protein